jgi:hypothetical protein
LSTGSGNKNHKEGHQKDFIHRVVKQVYTFVNVINSILLSVTIVKNLSY